MEYTFRCRKRFSVVASWSTSFHGRKRPTEKSFSVVVRQQAEGLVAKKGTGNPHEEGDEAMLMRLSWKSNPQQVQASLLGRLHQLPWAR